MNFKNIMIIFIMLSLMSVTFADADSNAEQAPVEILDIEIIDLDSISEDTDTVPAEIVGVTASPISPSNQDNYSVVVEVRGIFDSLYYEIKDSKETIVSDNLLVKDEYFECLSESIKGKPCKITFSNGVSSLLDGDITISLELREEDKVPVFKEKIITTFKDTEKPEIRRVNASSINRENVNKYSITIETNETDYVVDLNIGSTDVNLLSFTSLKDLNLSSLKDGTLILTLVIIDKAGNRSVIIDKAGNRSKPYIEIINKDTVVPELVLEQTEFFHNDSNITITGRVLDVVYEEITAWIDINGNKQDCSVVHTPIHYPDGEVKGLNKISCFLKGIVDGNHTAQFYIQDKHFNKNTIPITIIIDTTEVSLKLNDGNRNVKKEIKTIEGEIKVKKEAIVSFIATLKPTNSNSFTSLRYIPEIKDENKFIIDINKPVSGQELLPLKDEEYILRIYLKDIYGNIIRKEQIIIIDKTAPAITIDSLSTTDRTPVITGQIEDSNAKEVLVTINGNTYTAQISDKTWRAEISDILPLGDQEVKVVAKDEADNSNEISDSINIYSTGGGTRITPAAVPAPVETPVPVEAPVEEPAPVQITEPEGNTNTGGENLTPQETPIEEGLELEKTPIETPTPSGLTGFAGFASSPGGVVTIVGGALVVIGAIGYFFFLRPR